MLAVALVRGAAVRSVGLAGEQGVAMDEFDEDRVLLSLGGVAARRASQRCHIVTVEGREFCALTIMRRQSSSSRECVMMRSGRIVSVAFGLTACAVESQVGPGGDINLSLAMSRQVVFECESVWLEYEARNNGASSLPGIEMGLPIVQIERRESGHWTPVRRPGAGTAGAKRRAIGPGGSARGCVKLSHVICALAPGEYRLRVILLGGIMDRDVYVESSWSDLAVVEHAGNRALASGPVGSAKIKAWSNFLGRTIMSGWVDEQVFAQLGLPVDSIADYDQALEGMLSAGISGAPDVSVGAAAG